MIKLIISSVLIISFIFWSCSNPTQPDNKNAENVILKAPGNLQIEIENNQIVLNWIDLSANEDGYIIELATQDSSFMRIGKILGDSIDTFKEPLGKKLYGIYRISPFKEKDDSIVNGPDTITSFNSGPENLKTIIIEDNSTIDGIKANIELTWDDRSANEDGFYVERKINFDSFSEVEVTGESESSFNDFLKNSGQIIYKVKAINDQSESLPVMDTLIFSGWQTLPSFPANEFQSSVVINPNSVFYWAGYYEVGNTTYNTGSNEWSTFSNVDINRPIEPISKLAINSDGRIFHMFPVQVYGIYDTNINSMTMKVRSESEPPEYEEGFSVTSLPTGDILIVGTESLESSNPQSEIYSFESDSFTTVTGMLEPRNEHTATLLANGKVLLTGGSDSKARATAELFDPTTKSFTAVPDMNARRLYHTAVALDDGNKVLVCGDEGNKSCELYDATTNTWKEASPFNKAELLTAVELDNNTVLAITGDWYREPDSVELYDLDSNRWIIVSPFTLNSENGFRGRRLDNDFTIQSLPNGRIIFTGKTSKTALWIR